MRFVPMGGDTYFTKFLHWRQDASLFLPKNCWNGLKFLFWVEGLFLRSMAVFADSAHNLFGRKALSFPPLSISHTWLKRVTNFCLMWPFCCDMPGVVYSKFTPSPSCLQAFFKAIVLHASSQHRYHIFLLYLFFKFLIEPNITLLFQKETPHTIDTVFHAN